ncbi:hypothetical protein BJV82DRAFT_585544 [Fennellomyces sp. T-0311]|nr:hypothetical protein BJV82DRAFT_585544 [Fennellomyces sp. T-0311]
MQVVLHPSDHSGPVTPPSSQEKSFEPASPPMDISRHVASLKTRLDFACFKLHHGWESSTLLDVEMMWKKKQRQMYSEIPTPRVTQQDILDKRSQVPSARATNAKRARLTRTLSAPSPPPAHHTYKKRKYSQQSERRQTDRRRGLVSQPTEVRPRQIQPRLQRDPYRFYHPPTDEDRRKEKQQYLEEDELEEEDVQPKSSLEHLSYAIAMTEGRQLGNPLASSSSQPLPDISSIEPNAFEDDLDISSSQERTTLRPDWDGRTQKRPASAFHSVTNDDRDVRTNISSGESDEPSSPVAAAAQAIMMFVNGHYSDKTSMYSNDTNHH